MVQNEQGQQIVLRFFLSCINFSNNGKTHLCFFPSISPIISVKGCFCSISLTAVFGREFLEKEKKREMEREKNGFRMKVTVLMPKTVLTGESGPPLFFLN